ncbi:MAG: CvpA family protein [Anaerovoracaceae bacterium]|nr:CvpA family protein [Anaerovoracaceae bacterium]
MALDIFFGLILLCSVLLGIRSGFLAAVFHTCGWLIAVICAFVFNSKIRGLLSEHTHIYESIKENISQKFSEKVTQPIADALPVPDGFSGLLGNAAEKAADPAVTAVSNAVYCAVCFVLTVIAVMLVLYIFLRLFSKKYTDGVLGGLIGVIRGIVLVLLASVLLFPAVSLMSPELSESLASCLENSHFALYIYENNPFAEILDNMTDMYIGDLLNR